ncbi:hypothetical protein [Umezawaea beigongshangensis]|uniref:hypothetical protein n=1 Tax=Umezawaea beigongshangensis TaxID=2780383 RepID=UPI0018F1DC93|nr:hypothetical protein [Umezawaea beigongshangensis]
MTARRTPSPNAKSFEWWQAREHALTVACLLLPCGCNAWRCARPEEHRPDPSARPRGCRAEVEQPCVDSEGRELTGPPAHAHRLLAADAANPDAAPTGPAVPVDEPPARRAHLVSADRLRRDLTAHREPCSHCHRPIVWALNPAGDRVPVDADPSEGQDAALVTLHVDDRGVRCVLLTPGQVTGARAAGQRLHVPHRESCRYGHLWSRHRH